MQIVYGDSIWKGIIYGVDEYGNFVYLLWVEFGFGGKILQQFICNFRIDYCMVLQGDGSLFLVVVNINVFVIIQLVLLNFWQKNYKIDGKFENVDIIFLQL